MANMLSHSSVQSACPACGGMECLCRPRFFAGQLLTEADLKALDHYIIEKNKLHNRYLHGWGVVCGLAVVCDDCKGMVTIKSGYALDPCGNDIVVCEDQHVDVCAKIKGCCDQKQKNWECEPMASPPPDCKDLEQCWFITLRYTEFESRGITALKAPEHACSCGGCGCAKCQGAGGSGDHRHRHHAQHDCGCRTAAAPRRPAAQCEPTRTCESFIVDVIPAPPVERGEKDFLKYFDGTMLARVYECSKAVERIKAQRPNIPSANLNTAAKLQQACCLYKKAVWNFLNSHDLTRCELLTRASELTCPMPTSDTDTGPTIDVLDYLDKLLDEFLRDCACLALLPPCPMDPGDPRVILACVRVRGAGGDCRIVDICHWHGRRFVWTWPNAFYWVPIGALFKQIFENQCCNREIPEPPPPPPLVANLAIRVTADPGQVLGGLVFSVQVTNLGPNPAKNVVIKSSLSATGGMPVTPTAGSFLGGWVQTANSPFQAAIASLASGQTVNLSFKATVAGSCTVTHKGTVSADSVDPDLSNNTATAKVEIVIIL